MEKQRTILDLLREQNIFIWYTNKAVKGSSVKIPSYDQTQLANIKKALKDVPEVIKIEEYQATETSRFGDYKYTALRLKLTAYPSKIFI